MKTLATLFNVLFLAAAVFGSAPSVDREKTYSKSYPLEADDEVSIENSFGDVVIKTWDRREVKVDVLITTTAKSDQAAQQMLDAIEIEDRETSRGVSFRTEIGKIRNKGKNNKQEFKINYMVSMPADQALDLECSFGGIVLPDYRGELYTTCKFGSLEAGALTDAKKIVVEFGSVDIESLQDGDAVVKFSTGSIDDLSGEVDLKLEFCGDITLSTDQLERLDVDAANSTVTLAVPRNFSAYYSIDTNFGSFKNNTDFAIEDDEEEESFGPDFDTSYRGKSGSGNAEVVIDGSFSKIKLQH